ncbi:MAG: Succinyl-CoA synthetase, alpha subunit-related enzymes, partial [uncultured Solirubrobacteraceae bacterium]
GRHDPARADRVQDVGGRRVLARRVPRFEHDRPAAHRQGLRRHPGQPDVRRGDPRPPLLPVARCDRAARRGRRHLPSRRPGGRPRRRGDRHRRQGGLDAARRHRPRRRATRGGRGPRGRHEPLPEDRASAGV